MRKCIGIITVRITNEKVRFDYIIIYGIHLQVLTWLFIFIKKYNNGGKIKKYI